MAKTLSNEEHALLDAYWRAANYLSVGQIYLLDNPLLKEPLEREHIKPRLLGHWGTTPGLNFLYVHLNRVIKQHDLNMIYIIGPGHGGPALVANAYLEGTYSEVYPNISPGRGGDEAAVQAVLASPAASPATSRRRRRARIHEGGELGYALSHAYGAAFDNPGPDRRLRRRRRRGRDRAAGHQLALATSSSTRPATARCCRSCTSTATRSPTPASWPASATRSCDQLFRGLRATRRTSSKGDDPAAMHQQHGRRARHGRRRDQAASRPTRAQNGIHRAARAGR